MQQRLILAALSLVAFTGTVSAVEIAKPDEALVQRYAQNPDELAARVRECSALSVADAVGSTVCVSTQEARYRRERAVLRSVKGPSIAPTMVAQTTAKDAERH